MTNVPTTLSNCSRHIGSAPISTPSDVFLSERSRFKLRLFLFQGSGFHGTRPIGNYMVPTIAWLAQGKVRVKRPGESPRTIESQFGQSIRERAVRAQQRNSWKTGGEGEKFLSGA